MDHTRCAIERAGLTSRGVSEAGKCLALRPVPGTSSCGIGGISTGRINTGSCGFTLLELLVVLAVVAIVIGIGMPLVSNALPGTQLKVATSDLAAALRTTRNEAIRRNRSTALVLDTRARQYRIEHETAPRQLPEKIQLSLLTAESERLDDFAGRIRFFPDGSSTGGRIVLTGGGRNFSIYVNWILGRIRIAGG